MTSDAVMPSPSDESDLAANVVPLDERGRVAESLSCRGCGYDLMGIAGDAVCPECGSPVEHSIRGDLLQFCDPAWLGRLRQGLLLIFIGVIAGTLAQIGLMVGGALVGAAGAAPGGAGGAGGAFSTLFVGGGLATALITVVNVTGAWLVTTQDPGQAETEPQPSIRTVARFAVMASVIAAPMQMWMGQSMAGAVALVVGVVVGLIALVGWVAFYILLRRIVMRVPMPAVARQLRIIMWGYAVSSGFAIVLGFASMVIFTMGGFGGAAGASSLLLGFGLGSCASVAVILVVELWGAVLFMIIRGRLAEMIARELNHDDHRTSVRKHNRP